MLQNQGGWSSDSKFKYQQQITNSRCLVHNSATNSVTINVPSKLCAFACAHREKSDGALVADVHCPEIVRRTHTSKLGRHINISSKHFCIFMRTHCHTDSTKLEETLVTMVWVPRLRLVVTKTEKSQRMRWLQTYIAGMPWAVKNVDYFKKVTSFIMCTSLFYFECKEHAVNCTVYTINHYLTSCDKQKSKPAA